MPKLTGSRDTNKILQGMCIAVFCKGFAVVFSYLLHFVLARMLGSDGLGLFALAFAIVISASFLGRFGLDYVLLRHAALYSSSGQMGVLAAWCRQANLFAGGMALTLTIGIAVLGQWFCTEVFGKPDLYMPLIAMTAGLIPQTLLFLQAETLKGASCIRASQMLQGDGGGVLVFGAALCLSLPLAIPYGVTGAAMGFALASWVAYFAGCGMSARLFAGAHQQDPPAFANLLKLGMPLFIASALSLVVAKAGILFLGAWASATSVGVFAMAQKLALLGSNIQTACCTVIGPKIAVLQKKGDMNEIAAYYRNGTRLIAGLTAVVLGSVALLASPILGLLGADFVQGTSALRILAAGEMLALIFGPTSITLITTGHSREHCIAVGLAAAVMALGGLLIPSYGLEGAAAAVAISTVTQAVGQAVFIQRRLGFFPCIVGVG
ncbi:hypothetical protein DDIC_02060 [Desulfovibrio desulfuricans]|uniref:Uncharacterized protein n=1 Tax=Desulfovibrio desulfuricans TaxID=876 RepID=A0A4P7UG20_DESDE|nr:oligosaccharide flippase family protein [Desulfovibrio desulfuricans]QCC84679.1 hypothetical protein DDIC_02060 [Desulfovibrio desulfuricans]